ncbi:hypothetical protein BN946_scf184834.g33 [Trametes cinnabarina]|uniref:D-lactate dehydrogenase (cytochrome) n=1 Tax=Pycnoporus cinnabarinus TaxID=5643 RepID=A0A060S4B0_PYCCI|nr:hypothetical protein BN946_scf184834.g33 [Trametes cinnabarina]
MSAILSRVIVGRAGARSSRLWLGSHRDVSSSVSQLTPGTRLSGRLQNAIVGTTLLSGAALLYYQLSSPVHLDGEASIGGQQPERAAKVTVRRNTPESSTGTQYGSKEDVENAIEELRKAIPREGAVNTDPSVLQTYGSSDKSYHPTSPHSVVVHPTSTEEVVEIVNVARKYRVPIVPYSGATSLEGHFSGAHNDTEGDSDLVCQAGARWEDINSALKEKGIPLFFPLDPGPGATIGGMIGTGCSGTNAVRYGTARGEWFLNVTAVLPNGKVIKTRRRARKSSAGIDMTKLFIGAEGTLGIVTEGMATHRGRVLCSTDFGLEATLRLAPVIPTKVAMAQFPDVETAVSAVQEILNTPAGPHIQCVELLDDHMMKAIADAGLVSQTYPIHDTLFFKIQGDPAAIISTAKTVQGIVARHRSMNFKFAETEDEAEELWESRKYALMSTIESEEGARCWTTDVCVPVSKLPELVSETKKDLQRSKLRSTIVGHVGDGNFHAFILFKSDNELRAVSDAVHRLVHRAIALDGTCTGEHGVGVGKREYLTEELGRDTVELMWTIKRAIDPLDIMNPGKLYPDLPKDDGNPRS